MLSTSDDCMHPCLFLILKYFGALAWLSWLIKGLKEIKEEKLFAILINAEKGLDKI